MKNDIDTYKIYYEFIKGIDIDYQSIFEDEDIENYIIIQLSSCDSEKDVVKIIKSISKKIIKDFFFAFEYAATRNMGLSLFSVSNDLRKQQALLSSSVAEGSAEESENISKQITQLESRYNSTIKQITSLAANLSSRSSAVTLADREREYYDYKMGRKKISDKKDIREEVFLIGEKMKENAKLGLPRNQGLQDVLDFERHAESNIDDSGVISDRSRLAYLKKMEVQRQKRVENDQDESGDTETGTI